MCVDDGTCSHSVAGVIDSLMESIRIDYCRAVNWKKIEQALWSGGYTIDPTIDTSRSFLLTSRASIFEISADSGRLR